jgi:hypothetical protein
MLSLSYGGKLLIASIRIPHLTFFLLSLSYGMPRQQKWVIGEK